MTDVITPDGMAEIVTIFTNDSYLVEFPNRKRRIYFSKECKVI